MDSERLELSPKKERKPQQVEPKSTRKVSQRIIVEDFAEFEGPYTVYHSESYALDTSKYLKAEKAMASGPRPMQKKNEIEQIQPKSAAKSTDADPILAQSPILAQPPIQAQPDSTKDKQQKSMKSLKASRGAKREEEFQPQPESNRAPTDLATSRRSGGQMKSGQAGGLL